MKEKVKADVKEEIHRDAEKVLGKGIKDKGGIESKGIQRIAKEKGRHSGTRDHLKGTLHRKLGTGEAHPFERGGKKGAAP